ncbi:MAG: hypothetical protein ACOYMB_04730 [Patescibacteria group bacterium]
MINKDEEELKKEQKILDLLAKLDSIECSESLNALSVLLAYPIDYFKEEDLKRLSSCGNERYKSFVTLFLMKTN